MLSEKAIEAKLCRIVERFGGRCLKWVCPGWLGVPDRIILLPGGDVIFCELKRPGGKPSAMQKTWRRWLLDLGFDHWIVGNYDDLDDIDRYIADLMRK